MSRSCILLLLATIGSVAAIGGGGDDDHSGHVTCLARWDGEFACLDLAGITVPLCITIACLILFALFFERVIHNFIHAAQKDRFWRNFAAALLAELSMLGLISFSLFLASQMSDLTDDHVHLIEFVHLTLFLMMVFYYSVTAWIAYSSKRVLEKCGDYEEKVAKFDLVECIMELKTCKAKRDREWWCFTGPRQLIFGDSNLDKTMHLNAYLLTRHFFLVSQGLPPDLPFDYAEYIDRCSSALCVKLVQVGWRTWAGILLITGVSTGVTLAIDVSDGTLDQLQEMWAETAAVNLNYFWSMFFLGWVLYLVNGLIWACFERSRASLILLTAKKEAIGDNVRASRFDRSFDAGNFGDDEEDDDGHDNDGIRHDGDSSVYGNILRSTVSREWSHGGRHSHQVNARAERKENADKVREAHARSKAPAAPMPPPTVASLTSSAPLNRASHISRTSHKSGTSQRSVAASHASSSRNTKGSSHFGSTRSHNRADKGAHGEDHHRTSWEKTERALPSKICPCSFEDDDWRRCFPLRAPEFPLRTFQAVLMFFSLFLAMGLLIFFHIDPMFMAFSIFQPFAYLYLFGLQQVPFYASLRFFGPSLSKNSLVDDLVWFAQELQLEEYALMGREDEGKRLGGSFSTSMRSSTTFLGGASKLSSGTIANSSSSGQRPTEKLTVEGAPGDQKREADPKGSLLRGWGDAPTLMAPRASMRASATRFSFREPTIIEDQEQQEPGGLLRGWGDAPKTTLGKVDGEARSSWRGSNGRGTTGSGEDRMSSEHQRWSHRFEYRHSHLSRDTHLESFIRRREVEAGEAAEPRKAGSESALGGKGTRRSMNGLSLFAALRMSESRFSSRGDQGTGDRGVVNQDRERDWQSFNGESTEPYPSGLLAPLMEDRVKSRSREGEDSATDVRQHEYGVNVNLHLDPPAVQKEYATQDMLDEVCALLNATTVTNFVRIAIVRCAILAMFFVMFLYSDCEEGPGTKLECTWLDLF